MDKKSKETVLEEITNQVKKTTFISRLKSPATIIGAITGYYISGELPPNALLQIATSVVVAAISEHILDSSLPISDKQVVILKNDLGKILEPTSFEINDEVMQGITRESLAMEVAAYNVVKRSLLLRPSSNFGKMLY